MEDIIRSIKATPSAHKTLCTKFKAKSWMDVLAKCSEEQLVQTALVKIEQDSSNFSTFVTMLRDTPGLDYIADVMEERMRELVSSCIMNVASSIKVIVVVSRRKYFPPYAGGGGSSPSGGEEL